MIRQFKWSDINIDYDSHANCYVARLDNPTTFDADLRGYGETKSDAMDNLYLEYETAKHYAKREAKRAEEREAAEKALREQKE